MVANNSSPRFVLPAYSNSTAGLLKLPATLTLPITQHREMKRGYCMMPDHIMAQYADESGRPHGLATFENVDEVIELFLYALNNLDGEIGLAIDHFSSLPRIAPSQSDNNQETLIDEGETVLIIEDCNKFELIELLEKYGALFAQDTQLAVTVFTEEPPVQIMLTRCSQVRIFSMTEESIYLYRGLFEDFGLEEVEIKPAGFLLNPSTGPVTEQDDLVYKFCCEARDLGEVEYFGYETDSDTDDLPPDFSLWN